MEKADIFYKAMLSRDYRFDGKFYVGVKTTGIYCRPICPAKPKRENVEFFDDSISAENAGYRPCLRCHPEFSPETIAWSGKSAIVQRALKLISQNIMFDTNIESFAQLFKVSTRHLRRLFKDEIGMSPKQVSDLHRLNFANKLIQETHLDLITVALTSGFSSLRRFNDAFKKRYQKAPRSLRKVKSLKNENIYKLHVSYRPPLDWKHLLLYYKKHQIPFIEDVSDDVYQRIFKIDSTVGMFSVSNDEKKSQLEIKVHCQNPKILFSLVNHLRKMFDLNSDPLLINNLFATNPFLNSLWSEFPGLRIARGWNTFEIAIGTILGQVVSVNQAARLMGDVVKTYGEKVIHPVTDEITYIFPTPEVLSKATLDEIKTTTARKEAIRELSKRLVDNRIDFSEHQDPEDFKKQLKTIKGLGNWSAEYISLRGLGDTNAFPKDDLLLNRAITLNSQHFDKEQLAPWKSYLAVYLWTKYADSLSKKRKKNETT